MLFNSPLPPFTLGGKPITPTGNQTFLNGNTPKDSHVTENGTTVIDGATKLEVIYEINLIQNVFN